MNCIRQCFPCLFSKYSGLAPFDTLMNGEEEAPDLFKEDLSQISIQHSTIPEENEIEDQ